MPQVFAGIRDGVPGVERDLRRMVEKPDFVAESPRQIADLLLHTAYMGTEHSGEETRGRAADLAKEVSAFMDRSWFPHALLASGTGCISTVGLFFDARELTRCGRQIGQYHLDFKLDVALTAIVDIFVAATKFRRPRFRVSRHRSVHCRQSDDSYSLRAALAVQALDALRLSLSALTHLSRV